MNKNVISSFKFEHYKMSNIEFKLNKKYEEENEEHIKLDIGLGLNVSRSSTEAQKVMVTLNLKIFENYIEDNKPYFINIQMDGLFEIIDNMSDEQVNAFGKTSATAVMFPYLRSTVTQITSLSNCKPLVLPLINVSNLIDDHEDDA